MCHIVPLLYWNLVNFGGNLLGGRKEFVKEGFTMDVMVVAQLDYLFQHPENRGM